MNDLPPNVDEILSLLGEIDIIKAALGSFDKSINIALASDPVSELIGPEGHFYILKKLRTVILIFRIQPATAVAPHL